jgi:hypothetical protein
MSRPRDVAGYGFLIAGARSPTALSAYPYGVTHNPERRVVPASKLVQQHQLGSSETSSVAGVAQLILLASTPYQRRLWLGQKPVVPLEEGCGRYLR